MTKSRAYVFMVIMMAMTVVGGMLSSCSSAHAGPPERTEKPIMPIMPKPPEPPELPIMAERTSDYIRIQPHTVDISVPQAIAQVAANEYHYRRESREGNLLLMWSLVMALAVVIAYYWKGRKEWLSH